MMGHQQELPDGLRAVTIAELIGGNVKARRERLGWSQSDLGKQMEKFLGVEWSRQQVFTAERGIRAFTAVDITALALALGVPPGLLFENRPNDGIALFTLADDKKPISADWLTGPGGTSGLMAEVARDAEAALLEIARVAARYGEVANDVLPSLENFHRAMSSVQASINDAKAEGSDAS